MLVSRHTNSLQGGPTHISGSLARSASALSCIGGLQNSLQGSSAQISGSLARSASAQISNGGSPNSLQGSSAQIIAVPLLGLPGPFVVMAVRQMPTPREATVLLTNNISLSLSLL